jgi:hypothetical protein
MGALMCFSPATENMSSRKRGYGGTGSCRLKFGKYAWRNKMTQENTLFGPDIYKPDKTGIKHGPLTPAPLGSGPKGETCRTCEYSVYRQMSKAYWKCEKMRYYWTGGKGSDIRLKWLACQIWTKVKDESASKDVCIRNWERQKKEQGK